MEKEKTSFVTCYDNDCKDYAKVLTTLLSNDEKIANIKQDERNFDENPTVVSTEYILTIGEKSSAVNSGNFPANKYNDYGIKIGIYGHKAWICCEDFYWDEDSEHKFQVELLDLLKDLGMATDDIDKEIEQYLESKKKAKDELLPQKTETKNIFVESLAAVRYQIKQAANHSSSIFLFGVLYHVTKEYIHDLFKRSSRRDRQYRFAVAIFVLKYMTEFLKIEETVQEKQDF